LRHNNTTKIVPAMSAYRVGYVYIWRNELSKGFTFAALRVVEQLGVRDACSKSSVYIGKA
jgi:hypothetical protein